MFGKIRRPFPLIEAPYLDHIGANSMSWNEKPIFEVAILHKGEYGLLDREWSQS